MNSTFTRIASAAFPLIGLVMVGCHHHHEEPVSPPPLPAGKVVIFDEKGFRHEGSYDEHQQWHGGYRDDHGDFQPDPSDWRVKTVDEHGH